MCFTIAQSFWNNFCFWVKCIFLPQKSNFQKNMDFGAFFGNIHIIKARFLKNTCNFLSFDFQYMWFIDIKYKMCFERRDHVGAFQDPW